MAELTYVASALVTAALVLATVFAIFRYGDWRSYVVSRERPAERLRRLADSPAAWTVTFLLLVLGFGGAAVLYVSDVVDAATVGLAMILATVLVLGGYVFVGTYTAARSRGRPAAQGVAEAVVLLGFIAVFLVAAKLVAA